MPEKSINHYTFFKLADAYWEQTPDQRTRMIAAFVKELQALGNCVNFYQVAPLKSEIDFMVWNAARLEDDGTEARFFEQLGRVSHAFRPHLTPVTSLWGYTRPSMYSRAPSAQEIDPFGASRQTYLVLYPFVKTIQWYLLGRDTRQGMMNEHIRVGHQYPEIKQLLLYSFGVQDQEFIVVYEMETLYRFSELVNELRGSDVREYTERDTPVYTAVWRSPEALGNLLGGQA